MTVLQESDIYREWAPPPAWRAVVACCWEQHVTVEPDPRAALAVRLLRDHRVAEVADRIGTSARQLQRTMLTQVGLGPKTYQHVVRFRRFLAHAERGDALAVAAARAGYADQSHMSNEVRRLSSTTPAALLAERGAGG